jgi:hypothetical protein
MSSKYTIAVSNGSTAVTSGTLEVDTSTNPNTGSFTPAGGTAISCTSVAWPPGAGLAVNFTFRISGQADGGFLLNKNGTPFTYVFTGTQATSGASGSVKFPAQSPEADVDDTWQATAVPEPADEPAAKDTSTYKASGS